MKEALFAAKKAGAGGKLSLDGDKVKVTWSDAEKARARNTIPGIYEHFNEIENMIRICVPKLSDPENQKLINAAMERCKSFDQLVGNA